MGSEKTFSLRVKGADMECTTLSRCEGDSGHFGGWRSCENFVLSIHSQNRSVDIRALLELRQKGEQREKVIQPPF